MTNRARKRLDLSKGNGNTGPIKLLAFAILGLALFSLSLKGRTWAMPGQSPNRQTLPPPGAIAGKVFYDVNGDGQWEPGEEGIGGVQVIRDGGLGTYVSEEDGDYWFPNLEPGSTHTVSVIRPIGLFPTTAEQVTVTMPLISGTLPFAEGVNVFFGYQRGTYMPVVFKNYIPPTPDLSASTKKVDKGWANAGELLHYTIELRNTGTKAANVHFSDPLSAGMTLSGSVEGGVYRSGQVEWAGTLDVDATHTVEFDVRLDEGASGEIINTATIDDGYHAPFQRSASTQVMVTNPGFEMGDLTGWQHGGELARSVSVNEPHSGSYSVLLGDPNYGCEGGVPVGKSWIRQTFTVPSEGMPALSFWYRVHTEDHLTWTDGTLGDSFDVYINGSRILRDNYENFPDPEPGCGHEQDLGWKHFSYDLTGYRGQTITLRFENVSRQDPWYNTWTYVDDVLVSP